MNWTTFVGDRVCLDCGSSLDGYRCDADFCGAVCQGKARRRGERFWGGVPSIRRRRVWSRPRPVEAVREKARAV